MLQLVEEFDMILKRKNGPFSLYILYILLVKQDKNGEFTFVYNLLAAFSDSLFNTSLNFCVCVGCVILKHMLLLL